MNKNESPGRRLGISAFGGAAGARRRREKLILFGLIPQKLRVINQDRAGDSSGSGREGEGRRRGGEGRGGRPAETGGVIPGPSVRPRPSTEAPHDSPFLIRADETAEPG